MGIETVRSVAELVAFEATGKRVKYIHFWGHTPRKDGAFSSACFSQWYVSAFKHDGHVYKTAEHYMMAEKARLFNDTEQLEKTLQSRTAGEAKKHGRNVRGFVNEIWENHRFDIVTKASVFKFGSDPDMKAYLLGTGKRVLVEASPRDKIWGIGMSRDHDHAEAPSRWRGLNLLGFALMEARSQLDET